jgi:hypothetical protein
MCIWPARNPFFDLLCSFASKPPQPNFYSDKKDQRGQAVSGNDYIRCCFMADWSRHAQTMACPDPRNTADAACQWGKFAGPAWGHVNMYPSTLDWFLRWVLVTD